MKRIIMDVTVPLICKTPQDLVDLLNDGYQQKTIVESGISYLVKEEEL